MKWPHWLRHDWGNWEPWVGKRVEDGVVAVHADVRTCKTCGRRKSRVVLS